MADACSTLAWIYPARHPSCLSLTPWLRETPPLVSPTRPNIFSTWKAANSSNSGGSDDLGFIAALLGDERIRTVIGLAAGFLALILLSVVAIVLYRVYCLPLWELYVDLPTGKLRGVVKPGGGWAGPHVCRRRRASAEGVFGAGRVNNEGRVHQRHRLRTREGEGRRRQHRHRRRQQRSIEDFLHEGMCHHRHHHHYSRGGITDGTSVAPADLVSKATQAGADGILEGATDICNSDCGLRQRGGDREAHRRCRRRQTQAYAADTSLPAQQSISSEREGGLNDGVHCTDDNYARDGPVSRAAQGAAANPYALARTAASTGSLHLSRDNSDDSCHHHLSAGQDSCGGKDAHQELAKRLAAAAPAAAKTARAKSFWSFALSTDAGVWSPPDTPQSGDMNTREEREEAEEDRMVFRAGASGALQLSEICVTCLPDAENDVDVSRKPWHNYPHGASGGTSAMLDLDDDCRVHAGREAVNHPSRPAFLSSCSSYSYSYCSSSSRESSTPLLFDSSASSTTFVSSERDPDTASSSDDCDGDDVGEGPFYGGWHGRVYTLGEGSVGAGMRVATATARSSPSDGGVLAGGGGAVGSHGPLPLASREPFVVVPSRRPAGVEVSAQLYPDTPRDRYTNRGCDGGGDAANGRPPHQREQRRQRHHRRRSTNTNFANRVSRNLWQATFRQLVGSTRHTTHNMTAIHALLSVPVSLALESPLRNEELESDPVRWTLSLVRRELLHAYLPMLFGEGDLPDDVCIAEDRERGGEGGGMRGCHRGDVGERGHCGTRSRAREDEEAAGREMASPSGAGRERRATCKCVVNVHPRRPLQLCEAGELLPAAVSMSRPGSGPHGDGKGSPLRVQPDTALPYTTDTTHPCKDGGGGNEASTNSAATSLSTGHPETLVETLVTAGWNAGGRTAAFVPFSRPMARDTGTESNLLSLLEVPIFGTSSAEASGANYARPLPAVSQADRFTASHAKDSATPATAEGTGGVVAGGGGGGASMHLDTNAHTVAGPTHAPASAETAAASAPVSMPDQPSAELANHIGEDQQPPHRTRRSSRAAQFPPFGEKSLDPPDTHSHSRLPSDGSTATHAERTPSSRAVAVAAAAAGWNARPRSPEEASPSGPPPRGEDEPWRSPASQRGRGRPQVQRSQLQQHHQHPQTSTKIASSSSSLRAVQAAVAMQQSQPLALPTLSLGGFALPPDVALHNGWRHGGGSEAGSATLADSTLASKDMSCGNSATRQGRGAPSRETSTVWRNKAVEPGVSRRTTEAGEHPDDRTERNEGEGGGAAYMYPGLARRARSAHTTYRQLGFGTSHDASEGVLSPVGRSLSRERTRPCSYIAGGRNSASGSGNDRGSGNEANAASSPRPRRPG